MSELVLLKHRGIPDYRKIEVYESHGGYHATRKALVEIQPEQLVDLVKASGLRGRGGAGFPTGLKWSFLPKQTEKPVYLCVNADESEPGTFKDREIIEFDPHQLLEGIIITAYAIRCHKAFIYIRGEFAFGAKVLERAIEEAAAAGYLGKNILGSGFDLDVVVHRGAGAYICGEETGLIESLEGKRAYPRVKPPFPATYGVFGSPTIVNNVETLACVPHIVARGAEWFKSIGPEKGPGPKLYCVSGHVERPGVYELPMGTSLRSILYDHCGGILGGRKLKAVIPGGSSVPVFTRGRDRRGDGLRLGRQSRVAARIGGHHRDGRDDVHGAHASRSSPASIITNPAGSARRAARAPVGSTRCCAVSRRGAAEKRTCSSSSTFRTT